MPVCLPAWQVTDYSADVTISDCLREMLLWEYFIGLGPYWGQNGPGCAREGALSQETSSDRSSSGNQSYSPFFKNSQEC